MGDSNLSRALEQAYFEAAERNETWSGLPCRESSTRLAADAAQRD